MPGPDGLTITTKKDTIRTTVNVKGYFDSQQIYAFRHGPYDYGSCEDCGSLVLPEWFVVHAKWHHQERIRNFSGF